MKILVTGGAGFIGSNFVNTYFNDFEIVVLDNFSTGKLSNFDSNCLNKIEIITGDLIDDKIMDKIFKEHNFDIILHLAAISSVFQCQRYPIKCLEINYTASIKLIEKSIQYQVKKFIFASSAAVYGDGPDLPKSELTSLPTPISFYGIHKYAVERTLLIHSQKKEISSICFRFFNIYGRNQDPHSPYSGVISIFMNKILQSVLPEVTIFGSGKQTRDFFHVNDLIKILRSAMIDSRMNGQVFNLGSGQEVSLLQLVSILEQVTNKKIRKIFKEAREGDIERSFCNSDKINLLGYYPQMDLFHGLNDLYQYFNENSSLPFLTSPQIAMTMTRPSKKLNENYY